jgi:ribokinase
MSPKTRITVIGSLNKDLNARTPRLPSPGETLLASSFTTSSGGKGANQAVACSRLLSRHRHHPQQHEKPNNNNNNDDDGDDNSTNRSSTITVRMIGSVGSDQFGNESIAELEENGVDISGVRIRKDEKTGVAIVIVDDRTGENRILVSPNANFIWSEDELWRDLDLGFFPPSPPPPPLPSVVMEEDHEKMKKQKEEEDKDEDFELIILQLEIPLEIVCQIIQSAKQRKKNVHVLLNAAPARKLPREIYPGVTHLILNESEAKLLSSDSDSDSDSDSPAPSNENENETTPKEKEEEEEEEQTASKFLQWGVQNVIITLGARGAYYASSSSTIIKKGHQPIPTPVPAQNVIDTTGAGDTFVGAYAVRLCEDKRAGREMNVRERVEWANRVAAKSVQREGARGGMPWRDEVL